MILKENERINALITNYNFHTSTHMNHNVKCKLETHKRKSILTQNSKVDVLVIYFITYFSQIFKKRNRV